MRSNLQAMPRDDVAPHWNVNSSLPDALSGEAAVGASAPLVIVKIVWLLPFCGTSGMLVASPLNVKSCVTTSVIAF